MNTSQPLTTEELYSLLPELLKELVSYLRCTHVDYFDRPLSSVVTPKPNDRDLNYIAHALDYIFTKYSNPSKYTIRLPINIGYRKNYFELTVDRACQRYAKGYITLGICDNLTQDRRTNEVVFTMCWAEFSNLILGGSNVIKKVEVYTKADDGIVLNGRV